MAKMVWDQIGERLYETGVEQVALFVMNNGTYDTGVAWNGITAVNENPSGAEVTKLYANDSVYLNMMSVEELALAIEAYTYPDEFAECDGSVELAPGVYAGQQNRKHFGLVYKTLVGNDELSTDYGYKLHIVYDCLASPSEKGHATVNDNPEATTMSWDANTTPITIPGAIRKAAGFDIDSTKVDKTKLATLEGIIYGGESAEPTMPTPQQVIDTLKDVTGVTGNT